MQTLLHGLQDEEDKKKYMELEQTEKEKATFAQLRAQHDRGGEDPGGGVVRQLVNQNLQAKKEHANAR